MGLTFFDDRRLAGDLYAAASQSTGPEQVGAGVSRVLAPIVAHDGLSLVGTDPATGPGLGSFSFWHEYDPELVRELVMHRHLGGGPKRPAIPTLLRTPAVVVGAGTDGPPVPDPHMREILTAHGASSELRLLLRDRRGVWGALGLLRCAGAAPFGQDDAERAARLVPALLAALRRYATTGPLCPEVPPLSAGVITVGPDHRITAVSPQAQLWLDQWAAHAIPSWVPEAFLLSLSLVTRAEARRPGGAPPLVCAPPAACGRWTTCQGQVLDARHRRCRPHRPGGHLGPRPAVPVRVVLPHPPGTRRRHAAPHGSLRQADRPPPRPVRLHGQRPPQGGLPQDRSGRTRRTQRGADPLIRSAPGHA